VAADGGETPAGEAGGQVAAAVDLYWLPLGAGGHFVRLNGRIYEAVTARLQRRPPCDLYHSALQVELPDAKYVIEQAPVHDWSGKERGVVAEGGVGAGWAGRFRVFRYEIRLWPGGDIPDVSEAVDSPRRMTTDKSLARRVLDVVAQVPTRYGVRGVQDGRNVELQLGDRVGDRAKRDRDRLGFSLRPGCLWRLAAVVASDHKRRVQAPRLRRRQVINPFGSLFAS
jgi:hypothetical protein